MIGRRVLCNMVQFAVAALTSAAACKPRDMLIDLPPRSAAEAPKPSANMPNLAIVGEDLSPQEEALLDRSISPCESFYDYACGGSARLPPEQKLPLPYVMPESERASLVNAILAAPTTSGARSASTFYSACVHARFKAGTPPALWKLESQKHANLRPREPEAVLRAASRLQKRGVATFFTLSVSQLPTPDDRVALEFTPYPLSDKSAAADVAKAAGAVGLSESAARTMSDAVERVQRALAPGAPARDLLRFTGNASDPTLKPYAEAFAELGIAASAPLATRYPAYFLALPGRIDELSASDLRQYFDFRLAAQIAEWLPAGGEAEWKHECATRTLRIFADGLRSEIATRTAREGTEGQLTLWFARVRKAIRAAVERGDLVATPRAAWLDSLDKIEAAHARSDRGLYDRALTTGPILHQLARHSGATLAANVALAGEPFRDRIPTFDALSLLPVSDRFNRRVIYPPAALSLGNLGPDVPSSVIAGSFGALMGEAILDGARPTDTAIACDATEFRAAKHAAVLRALSSDLPSWAADTEGGNPVLLRRRVFIAFAQSQCALPQDTARLHVNRAVATVPIFQSDYACSAVAMAPAACPAL